MNKKLLFIPLFVGLILMACSWYLSYPLTINSTNDFVFNHVSVYYWFSLPLSLASMFLIAATSENKYMKWIMTVGIVMAIYSTSYFYFSLPTSDAHLFKGLNEYFISTKSLDSTLPDKFYFQWPSFFILSDVATSVSGLGLASFEFITYGILGILLTTTFYLVSSKTFEKGAFISVIAFFIGMFYYFNYQFAPFTLAFGLLLLLFVLDSRRLTPSTIITTLFLFTAITFTHEFVSVFFIVFLGIKLIINRSKQQAMLCFASLAIYSVYQIAFASAAVKLNILQITGFSSEVSSLASYKPVSIITDVIAQRFVAAILISTVVICVIGFVALLFRRKTRDLNQIFVIFITGVVYVSIGLAIYILGSRALPLVFFPIAIGAAYLFQSRLRPYVKTLFLVLLVLFVAIPIHVAFVKDYIFFQTDESCKAENFFVSSYNWASHSSILADKWIADYFNSRVIGNAVFLTDLGTTQQVNAIFYTVGLGITMGDNYTIDKAISEERLNVIYNNGFSLVTEK